MTRVISQLFVVAVLTMCTACASRPAQASGWRLDPSRCPDLVEDYRDARESRRDERVDRGPLDRAEDRLDRRESRRDRRVTVCPTSAWVWTGRARPNVRRPTRAAVYYDAPGRRYYRYGPNRTRVRVVVR